MYDNHIYCNEYRDLKYMINDILCGDNTTVDVNSLADHIQELYDNGSMSSSQYDDLMSYIQDLLY